MQFLVPCYGEVRIYGVMMLHKLRDW